MNKHSIIYFLFALFSTSLFFSSCKEDLSSLDLNKISGVSFDTTGTSSLNVFQFEHLVVKPNISTDLNPTDLSYEWKINVAPGSLTYDVIGHERDLDAEIRLRPTDAYKFHQVIYTITDKNTGLKYVMGWPLIVRNSISEGLVIAETTDGNNTDISHIMSPLVTPEYNQVSVKHNIYSSLNGATIPGLIKEMRYTNLKGTGPVIMGITNNSLITIKTLDYSAGPADEALFYNTPAAIKPQTLAGLSQVDVYVGNNEIHGVWLAISDKIGLPFASSYKVPDHIALDARNSNIAVALSFYDETNERFVYQPSLTAFGDRTMHMVPSASSQAFNPTALPSRVNVAADATTDGDYLHLLKDKNTGKIGLYVLGAGRYDASNSVVPPYAKSFFDLSNAPEIEAAGHFVLLDDQRVMYYATKTKIYAMLYGASNPLFELRYTAPAGEEITTLQIYRQANYPFKNGYLPTNNKQLIMSTFSGTEGKVYLLPMTNPGVGNIDAANIKTYGGFKKITAIAPQL
jgi:hypothetical protein